MYYIPKLNNDFSKLDNQQIKISNSKEFLNLFTILSRQEKVIFINKLTYLQYSYHFKYGIDQKPLFSITVDKEGNIKESNCDICRYPKHCHHLKKIATEIKEELEQQLNDAKWVNNREQYIKEKEKEEKERLRQEEELKRRNESLEKVSNLLASLNEQEIQPLQKLVQLFPIISIYSVYRGLKIELGLKIGIDKPYSVSSYKNFFDNIKNNNEYTYGKYLSFKHNLDNFDLPSRSLIELLIDYKKSKDNDVFGYGYGYSNMFITVDVLEKLFFLYKGKSIDLAIKDAEINGSYFLNLSEVDIGFKLDKKYHLSIVNKSNGYLFESNNNIFSIKDNQIYLVKFPDKKMYPLFKFINQNTNFSFKNIKDVFTKEILARYYNHIEIDEEIKEEISLKEFLIESYFDYDIDKIKLITKYSYDGKVISLEEITNNKYTNLRVEKYNLLLRSLGIEDNEITESNKIFQFLQTDLTNLKEISTVYLSERLARMQAKTYQPIKMNLSYQTGLLSVCLEGSSYSDEELAKIIKALRKKTRYIKLKNNVILEVDEESANRLLNTVEEFNLNTNSLSKPQNIPLFQALKINDKSLDIIEYIKTEKLENLLSDIANYKNADFLVPKEVESLLRSYQKEAFLWMKTLVKYQFCGILADDMGLGKSLEMISVILSDEANAPSLIVCPKSLCYNWKNEFDIWAPNLKIVNVIGNVNERKLLINNIDNNHKCIYITSYDSLRSDLELYDNKTFEYMILDEAQYIKNHETLKAQSVKKINSKLRFVLTGTPIENSVVDLWSIFDFLMPGYLYKFTDFKTKYERSIIERKDSSAISNLVYKISPFILRRTKQDVIKDLPEKYETIQTAKMTDGQRKIYEAELKRTKDMLESSDNKIQILACITRLRQVCVDPGMYVEGYNGGSGKVSLVMELIDEYIESGSRILLFSQFTSIFSSIENLLNNRKIKYFILTGKTSASDRVSMASDFNENDATKVFLVSLKAGGTGLNLVGADVVIHLDPWWNVAAENQASDRAHRIGQMKVVQVVKLVSEDSIEQKVIELQERKKEIVKLIVTDDDSNITKLSKDDLNYLLMD